MALLPLNKDGCADIIGFGEDGVWTAIGNGDGTFHDPIFVLENFGYNQGWRVKLIAQEACEFFVLLEKRVLPVGTKDVMAMLDLIEDRGQLSP
jgi:hypothetical protein